MENYIDDAPLKSNEASKYGCHLQRTKGFTLQRILNDKENRK
jgi:hypothetical protein